MTKFSSCCEKNWKWKNYWVFCNQTLFVKSRLFGQQGGIYGAVTLLDEKLNKDRQIKSGFMVIFPQ